MRFEPATIEEFQARIKSELVKGRVFCYFFASEIPETGVSWCPDCVKAEPIITRVFEEGSSQTRAILLKIPVGQKGMKIC